jgi:hypothetical protein
MLEAADLDEALDGAQGRHRLPHAGRSARLPLTDATGGA